MRPLLYWMPNSTFAGEIYFLVSLISFRGENVITYLLFQTKETLGSCRIMHFRLLKFWPVSFPLFCSAGLQRFIQAKSVKLVACQWLVHASDFFSPARIWMVLNLSLVVSSSSHSFLYARRMYLTTQVRTADVLSYDCAMEKHYILSYLIIKKYYSRYDSNYLSALSLSVCIIHTTIIDEWFFVLLLLFNEDKDFFALRFSEGKPL